MGVSKGPGCQRSSFIFHVFHYTVSSHSMETSIELPVYVGFLSAALLRFFALSSIVYRARHFSTCVLAFTCQWHLTEIVVSKPPFCRPEPRDFICQRSVSLFRSRYRYTRLIHQLYGNFYQLYTETVGFCLQPCCASSALSSRV